MDDNANSHQNPETPNLTLQRNRTNDAGHGVSYDDDLDQKDSNEQSNSPRIYTPGEKIVLEYLDQNPYSLSYTCLIIPRFNSHYLIGDIVDQLPVWMKQICISYGWNLDFLSIKAEHLQWTIRVPPATSAGHFMRVLRDQTSISIFENFPRFKRENLSNDFWAPGYLVVLGSQPHPVEMIRRFIQLTRQQQGIASNE